MKNISTLLIGMFFVFGAFSQSAPTCLYLTNVVDPFSATGNDQVMYDIIFDLGYDVTAQLMGTSSPTTGYDVVVCSEAIGSTDPGWKTYQQAPMPMVNFKNFAIRASALAWIPEDNWSETTYWNAPDSIITLVAVDHPILTGFTEDDVQVISGEPGEAQVGFVVIPPTYGLTEVALSGLDNPIRQSIVAMDEGTDLNGNILASRAVIIAFHQDCWEHINENGIKIIENALEWARTGSVGTGLNENSALKASVYPNPSKGIVHLQFDHTLADVTVTVLSVDGREVLSRQFTNAQFEKLDLSGLHTGIYFIHFVGSDLSHTVRLILNK